MKRMQNYLILVFFEKKFISKDIKAIKYKMNSLNRIVDSSKRSPWDLHLSRICLTAIKKGWIWQKTKIHFLFFLWKTRVEDSKVITNSLKTLGFVTPIPFDTLLWNLLCDLSLMKLGNNETKKKNARLCNTCFYGKKFVSKDMKAINYKKKRLNRFLYVSKGSPRDLQLARTSLTSTKRLSNMTKIKY